MPLHFLQGEKIPFLRIKELPFVLIAYAEDIYRPLAVWKDGFSIIPSFKSDDSFIFEAYIVSPSNFLIIIFPSASIILFDWLKDISSA